MTKESTKFMITTSNFVFFSFLIPYGTILEVEPIILIDKYRRDCLRFKYNGVWCNLPTPDLRELTNKELFLYLLYGGENINDLREENIKAEKS